MPGTRQRWDGQEAASGEGEGEEAGPSELIRTASSREEAVRATAADKDGDRELVKDPVSGQGCSESLKWSSLADESLAQKDVSMADWGEESGERA